LRVNKNTPEELLDLAVDCIASGVGSPLLSNDEVVIPRLVEFGIPKEDAQNYTVSACWEPLIGGKSVSLNNMTTLNFMRPFENLIKRDNLTKIENFDDLMDRYEFYLEKNINAIKRIIDGGIFQKDLVMSVFMEGCMDKDASKGGAKYFHAGITTVALGNLVNSLLNIKKYVFDENKYSLIDVKKALIFNFENAPELYDELKRETSRYGLDEKEPIELSRKIACMVTKYTKDYRTPYGGRLKFGLSAPVYVDAAVGSLASFDGRKAGEPFNVHISNEDAESYTQVINFAAAMDYHENRFNGNVVDFMTNPSFLSDNKEKFKYLIMGAVNQGFFQMQANVVSSSILIDAMEHPEKHIGLIVRVWGFSAYFNDLPEVYKKVLISRALANERKMANR
jgi:formate C-acetyltransferase